MLFNRQYLFDCWRDVTLESVSQTDCEFQKGDLQHVAQLQGGSMLWVVSATHSIELLSLKVSTTCETQPMATHSAIL
jgi:hypothetical protein